MTLLPAHPPLLHHHHHLCNESATRTAHSSMQQRQLQCCSVSQAVSSNIKMQKLRDAQLCCRLNTAKQTHASSHLHVATARSHSANPAQSTQKTQPYHPTPATLPHSHSPRRTLRARLRCWLPPAPPSLRVARPPPRRWLPPPPPAAAPLPRRPLPRALRLGFWRGFHAPLPRNCQSPCA